MKFVVGKYSGFCGGVNYTYRKALEELDNGRVYCLGQIIHNELVIKNLEKKGMITIDSLEKLKPNSRVIFRAHGESKDKYEYAKEHDIEIIDLTCPKVKHIHDKVTKKKDDSFIIIFGQKKHPEIVGTSSFAGDDYLIIEDLDDLDKVKKTLEKSNKKNVYIVSQTTFSNNLFDELTDKLKNILKDYKVEINKSICDATYKRQTECDEISKDVDVMLVIGSKNSANTKELYNIAKENCSKTYYIETVDDLEKVKCRSFDTIGVVAGASAPRYLIDSVLEYFNEK